MLPYSVFFCFINLILHFGTNTMLYHDVSLPLLCRHSQSKSMVLICLHHLQYVCLGRGVLSHVATMQLLWVCIVYQEMVKVVYCFFSKGCWRIRHVGSGIKPRLTWNGPTGGTYSWLGRWMTATPPWSHSMKQKSSERPVALPSMKDP